MNHKPWKRTDWSGKRVLVVGLGSFDGGLGAVRFLLQQNAQVTISDLKSPEKLRNSIAAVEAISPDGIVWSLGEHDVQLLDQTDLLVINPAVDKSSELIQAALSRGIPWTSEMNLFLERNRGYTIAVTGSNGKSTTTAMIHHILSLSQKRVWLGGEYRKKPA